MAATTIKVSASAKLEDGRDESGVMHYSNLPMGNMDEDYWENNRSAAETKILAVRAALAPCLIKTMASGITLTTVEEITAD